MTVGLFCSPYGATSIREYFANAFEYYFIKDPKYVKKVSPRVYVKINQLSKEEYFY
jgi:Mlc titration factor MtfA (ptsG expression regulator)